RLPRSRPGRRRARRRRSGPRRHRARLRPPDRAGVPRPGTEPGCRGGGLRRCPLPPPARDERAVPGRRRHRRGHHRQPARETGRPRGGDPVSVTAAADAGAEVREPPRRRRAALAWIAIAVVLLIMGAVGAAMSNAGEWTMKEQLDPDGTGPTGARALAEVLRDQG